MRYKTFITARLPRYKDEKEKQLTQFNNARVERLNSRTEKYRDIENFRIAILFFHGNLSLKI